MQHGLERRDMDDSTTDSPTPGEGPLARLVNLAAAVVRRVEPLRYEVARADAEREAIYRLRHRVVMERGWARPEDLPDGIERDGWDDGAVHVGGWNGDELVACARLVFPSPDRRLPVEAVFDLTLEGVERVVHVDRLIVARGVSEHGHRALMGLVAFCWLETHARGRDVWTGIDSRLTIRLYRAIGFEVEVIGPGRRYWNEERFPVRFDTAAAAEAIAVPWGRVANPPSSDCADRPTRVCSSTHS
jgi:N-acyl-L-homoserine lactone synthetase